jgi:hypothetical protein
MLILLVALPFTAPFSTCNLSELMSATHALAARWTAAGQPAASIEGATTLTSPGSVLEEEFKDGALSDAPAVAQVSSRADAAPLRLPHDTHARAACIALRL